MLYAQHNYNTPLWLTNNSQNPLPENTCKKHKDSKARPQHTDLGRNNVTALVFFLYILHI